ncbi:MAG: hypothetical protein GWN71_28010 [Gammaproteobacteria bacterium]|nr:hypothetical protein [Gemmatimonadota bacterium]NIU77257.1 hypothetical protein [Gammaproteobacteria bacterium]
MCDFTGGVAPEITKRRPVVVVGPRLPGRSRLYAVVPLSGARPRVARAYHVRLPSNPHPGEADARPVWAKCDLLQNVSIDRLDRFRLGAGRYTAARRLDAETLEAVRAGMLAALGLAEGRST